VVGCGLRELPNNPQKKTPRDSPSASAKFPRLAPAQNAGAVPVTTIAPIDESPSIRSIATTISATIGAVMVLRSSGLFNVIVATPSAISRRTKDMAQG
jgi:hypothetical protein